MPRALSLPLSSALLLSALSACGPAQEPAAGPPPALPPAKPTAAPAAEAKAEGPFENPGGMWMPEQLPALEAEFRHAGFEIDPKKLADPTSAPLGAVVSLGGCSASFVSPEGLVVTNHHCVTGALQYGSSKKENLLRDGFLAKTRAEERSAGPTQRIYVTRKLEDVTDKVREGLDAIKDPNVRHEAVEKRQKELVAACEKDRPEIRCTVASYYGGGEYRLIEQLEIEDVRLVYAPEEGIGNYGGETDNWRWPRHSGDFAFYRAYVGKDGKPAPYAKDNVPYKPPHHLKLASSPLGAGDAVLVAGYPGQTNRLRTAGEVKDALAWLYPRRIKYMKEYGDLLKEVSKKSPEIAIKARPTVRGLDNALTKYRGIVEGLEKGGLAAEKAELDKKLSAFVAADPARKAKYGDVLPRMDALIEESKKHREKDAMVQEAIARVQLLGAATKIARMAEERPKPDAEREPGFQARDFERLEKELERLEKSYDPFIDKAVLGLVVEREQRLPEAERPGIAKLLTGKDAPAKAEVEAAADKLFKGTKLGQAKTRIRLLKSASTKELEASRDPLIKMALALRPLQKAAEERDEAMSGELVMLRPRYVEALRLFTGGKLAPDANGTLRISFGTVRGYSPKPGAEVYKPFTGVSGVVEKHKGEGEFDAPDALLEAAKAKKFGPYVAEPLGEVPVDFLSDLDITGGNSGSATLNAKGELVGLAFDGNYEAMASDWVFIPKITRAIHVDLRYVLWVMDAVAGADHLLEELGVKPSIP